MTEVEAVLPEGVSLPSSTATTAPTNSPTGNNRNSANNNSNTNTVSSTITSSSSSSGNANSSNGQLKSASATTTTTKQTTETNLKATTSVIKEATTNAKSTVAAAAAAATTTTAAAAVSTTLTKPQSTSEEKSEKSKTSAKHNVTTTTTTTQASATPSATSVISTIKSMEKTTTKTDLSNNNEQKQQKNQTETNILKTATTTTTAAAGTTVAAGKIKVVQDICEPMDVDDCDTQKVTTTAPEISTPPPPPPSTTTTPTKPTTIGMVTENGDSDNSNNDNDVVDGNAEALPKTKEIKNDSTTNLPTSSATRDDAKVNKSNEKISMKIKTNEKDVTDAISLSSASSLLSSPSSCSSSSSLVPLSLPSSPIITTTTITTPPSTKTSSKAPAVITTTAKTTTADSSTAECSINEKCKEAGTAVGATSVVVTTPTSSTTVAAAITTQVTGKRKENESIMLAPTSTTTSPATVVSTTTTATTTKTMLSPTTTNIINEDITKISTNKTSTTAPSSNESDGGASDLSLQSNIKKSKNSTNNSNEIIGSQDESADCMDISDEPLSISSASSQRENGVVSSGVKSLHNESIVDLGGDTDEEMPEVPNNDKKQQNGSLISNTICGGSSMGTKNSANTSICTDSDGAVVINSDSENEAIAITRITLPPSIIKKPLENIITPGAIVAPATTTTTTSNTSATSALAASATAAATTSQIIDDDDDDCVVIEDDTPIMSASDLSKRKSIAMDSPSFDESMPPNKRQRNCSIPTNINQLALKDARSLMPPDMTNAIGIKRTADGIIYPVNINTTNNLSQTGPPKLVPMTNPGAGMVGFSGLPGMNSNANLLPGLTDDMFVLEAPSFIVPYIYEKPPTDNLKEIIREIEAKHRLSKEDLAVADKCDEFDMTTEQNKEEKEEKPEKKKKRPRGGDDNDDSWSEESEEDEDEDDDDDSETGIRTKVLIKEASDDLTALKGAIKPVAAVVQSPSGSKTGGQEDYFESPLGKFFMDIGVGLVQEYVQHDLIRLQKRKLRKSLGKNLTEIERAIAALSGNLEASKKKNIPFKFQMKRCEFCNFKSESALSMANHYETPHMNGPLYKCNFCSFEIRNATEIVYHMEAVHNIKAKLIKPLPYHQCPNCGFEDNGKAKLARHQPVCAKKFRPELNLAPPNDWEAPAKIPRIKPRHGLVGTATAYQAMAAQAAAQKAALASIQQQQQQAAAQSRNLQAAALAAQNVANKMRNRMPMMVNKPTPPPMNVGCVPQNVTGIRMPTQIQRPPVPNNVVLPNNYQMPQGGQLMQQPINAITAVKRPLTGQPSISITPLPRQSVTAQAPAPSTSKIPAVGMKPGQIQPGNKTQFVICEICDGYIKDLEQLRNHMQWMHKVKIHPKMIYNRPPLNCQKCQFRFFTDQGLERHLLGSHGLVTSSMQEAANKGKDAGRCPVCGRMYQWKLLNHVSRDHHMTLKPAHLSYKCTVCTATFGMYKQFETHVYTAHSTVAKKAIDNKKSNSTPMSGVGINAASTSNVNQRGGLSATNECLLKPLKINDEITIIPQPATKPRITNMESHVID